MSNHAVNMSNKISQRIKEELLRILSVISYSEKYEFNEDEYQASSQSDVEIIKSLEETDKRINDYDNFINSNHKVRKSSKAENIKNSHTKSSILHTQDVEDPKFREDDGRTF